MQRSLPLTALAVSLLLTACAPSREMTRVDESLLQSLPVERLEPVQIAVDHRSLADDAHANSRRLVEVAERTVRLARAELEVATDGVEHGRVELERTLQGGRSDEMRAARFRYDDALMTANVARLAVALAKREHEVAVLRETLALEEARLADARVELAKGLALEGLELPPEDAVALQDLREQVEHHEDEMRRANRRLSTARVEMQMAQSEYDVAVRDARLSAGV